MPESVVELLPTVGVALLTLELNAPLPPGSVVAVVFTGVPAMVGNAVAGAAV